MILRGNEARFGVSLYQDEELFEMKLKKLELTDTFMCAFRAEQKKPGDDYGMF